jgi:hypothetical protein
LPANSYATPSAPNLLPLPFSVLEMMQQGKMMAVRTGLALCNETRT